MPEGGDDVTEAVGGEVEDLAEKVGHADAVVEDWGGRGSPLGGIR
jgi:hypothetical protein